MFAFTVFKVLTTFAFGNAPPLLVQPLRVTGSEDDVVAALSQACAQGLADDAGADDADLHGVCS